MVSARSLLPALALACVSALGCEGEGPPADDTIPPPPYQSFSERPCPKDSALTWENFGEPFMRNWCTACHAAALPEETRAGAPESINFDDLHGVRAHAERIWARGADQNNTMPPAGVPPELERAQLGEWLACGARSRDD